MKDRPIIFSGPWVRAILAGRKTQTRRIVKPQPPECTHSFSFEDGSWWENDRRGFTDCPALRGQCPHGVPGDRLWVKHTHWYKPASDLTPEIVWSPELPQCIHRDQSGTWISDLASTQSDIDKHGGFRWRPSIHMPRWASRLTLEIVSVRVERLQDISEEDAIAEGMSDDPEPCGRKRSAVSRFAELWESINGAGSWESNPWVWVIEFNRVEAST